MLTLSSEENLTTSRKRPVTGPIQPGRDDSACVVTPQESGCRKDFVPGHFYTLDGPSKDENCEFEYGEI